MLQFQTWEIGGKMLQFQTWEIGGIVSSGM
jgi:hypothetical protein